MNNQKAYEIFGFWDADGDGVITEDDFRALAQRFLGAYDVAADSVKGQAVVNTHVAMWTRMGGAADRHDNKLLNREEFAASFNRPASERSADDPTGFENYLAPMTRARFAVADTNGTGTLDEAAFTKLFVALGTAPDDAVEAFTLLDTDGDGTISTQEYVDCLREFDRGSSAPVIDLLHRR